VTAPARVRAVLFPGDGDPIRVLWIEPTLAVLRDLVGGWIEGFTCIGSRVHGYCNEEGKLDGLPVNGVATSVARALGWPAGDLLVGPVVMLGDHPKGDESDVPTEVVDWLARMCGDALVDETVEGPR
jgi:hypothetical protein